MVTHQLLDTIYFPLKPHVVFTVPSPHYVVLGVRAFNQERGRAASVTRQIISYRKMAVLFQDSTGARI